MLSKIPPISHQISKKAVKMRLKTTKVRRASVQEEEIRFKNPAEEVECL
jgi:hypothetical protein